jgi:GGDEF domain-containing protein
MEDIPLRRGPFAMSDLSYLHPQVEILSASPRQEMLADRLRRLDLRPVRAEMPQCLETPQPLLIDLPSITAQQASQLKRAWLRGIRAQVILLRPHDHGLLRSREAIMLSDEHDLDSLPARLELRRRQAIRRNETEIRRAVSERLGELPEPDPGDALQGQILHVSGVSERFLPQQRAFLHRGLRLRPALSAETALSCLETETFCACLVEFADGEPGQAFLDRLAARPGPRPPIVVISRNGQLPASGIADEIVSADLPAEIVAATLEELVRQPPLSTRQAVTRLSSRTHDPATGLYNMDFLRACLPLQIKAADAGEEPLCLLHLKLRSARDNDVSARAALTELSRFLISNLRVADLAARVGPSAIMVSLRNTPYAGALALARRLVSSLGGENVGAPGTALDFGGSLSWRVVERRAYHTADMLIASALSGPYAPASAA